MEILLTLLKENYHIFVPVLWVIGYALKRTPFIPNWSIIWFLLGFSFIIGSFSYGFSLDTLINGIIAVGVAVFGHQVYKQTYEAKAKKKK
ncbi:phage holin family protein [Fredinandcohnia humi]